MAAVAFAQEGGIEGTVRDALSKAPVAGVTIEATGAEATRDFTVNTEKFTMDELPPGKWVVEVESNVLQKPEGVKLFIQGARFGTQDAIGETLGVAESGNPALEIRLTGESGRIVGTVVDGNGLPRKRVLVLVSRGGTGGAVSSQSANSTGEDGTVVVDGLAAGSYRVMVVEEGRSANPRDSVTVDVKTGETAVVRMVASKP